MYNFYSLHGADAFIYKNYISNSFDNGIYIEYNANLSACSSLFFKEYLNFSGEVVDKIVDFIIAIDNSKHIDILFIHADNKGHDIIDSMNWSIPVYIIAFEISNNETIDNTSREILKQHGYSFDNSIGNVEFYINSKNNRFENINKNIINFSFKSTNFDMHLNGNVEEEIILINNSIECKFNNLLLDIKSNLLLKLEIKPRLILLTFGSDVYYDSIARLMKTAANITHFDLVIGYTDKDLIDDHAFWNKHNEFIMQSSRGYGYWIWKSYINMKILNKINTNDIVLYMDAGCALNINNDSINRLLEYIAIVKNSKSGLLSFELNNDCTERKYTKMDLIDYMKCYKYLDTPQLLCTTFMYKKTSFVEKLFDEWYNISCNYNLINDESFLPNDINFIDHRHDQSIFSLLRKKYITEVISDETYWDPDWRKKGYKYPIWAIRKKN